MKRALVGEHGAWPIGHHIFGRQSLDSCCTFKLKTAHAILYHIPIWAGHETGMTTPANVRCDLYSGKNGAFGA